jgi:hypothetical protein
MVKNSVDRLISEAKTLLDLLIGERSHVQASLANSRLFNLARALARKS